VELNSPVMANFPSPTITYIGPSASVSEVFDWECWLSLFETTAAPQFVQPAQSESGFITPFSMNPVVGSTLIPSSAVYCYYIHLQIQYSIPAVTGGVTSNAIFALRMDGQQIFYWNSDYNFSATNAVNGIHDEDLFFPGGVLLDDITVLVNSHVTLCVGYQSCNNYPSINVPAVSS